MRFHCFSVRPYCLWTILVVALACIGYSEDTFYSGTGTVVFTVQCGTTTHSVTGSAEVAMVASNDVYASGFHGKITHPYLFRFPREPAIDPIVATLEYAGFPREHAFSCTEAAEVTMPDDATLICPPVGGQNHVTGGGFSEDGAGSFDWLVVNVVTHCTGNTCTGAACSVKTTVKWEFRDVPSITVLTNYNEYRFAGRVQDPNGLPLPNKGFLAMHAHGFEVQEAIEIWPDNTCDTYYNGGQFSSDDAGRFSVLFRGRGPIRVMGLLNFNYNGYSSLWAVPETNAVIVLIPHSMDEFICVQDTVGQVEARELPDGPWLPVQAGTTLPPTNYHFRAYSGASATIAVPAGERAQAIVKMQELSEYVYQCAPFEGYTFLESLLGEFVLQYVSSKSPNPPGKFELKTSAGIAGSKGTGFRIVATGAVHVFETSDGVVFVTPTNSAQTWNVPPGRRLRTDGASVWMESLASNEWAALAEEVKALACIVEPSLETDFGEGKTPYWMNRTDGSWGVAGSNMLRFAGYRMDAYPFALINYPCADASLQADVRKVSGDAASYVYGYGLHLRSDAVESNYYEFAITRAGHYMIGKYVNGAWVTLVSWRTTNALRTGYGVWNTLKATARGTNLYFYANGQLLKTLGDSSLSNGYFGLCAIEAAASTNTDIVEYDNVVLVAETPNSGTHPPLLFEHTSLPGGARRLSWSGQPAEWYTVKSSSNLLEEFGTVVTQNLRGEFPITTWTAAPPTGTRYFRIDRQ